MRLWGAALLVASFAAAAPALATTPPAQPKDGPAGADYPIQTGDVTKEAYGAGARQVFVFRPTRGFDGPRPAVVFGHAVNAFNPLLYGAWIDHLARHGTIVVFPRYQLDARQPRNELIGHAAAGVKLAMEKLGDAVDPEKVAYVGHAAGGNIVVNLAADPSLWKPKLVLAVMPGNSWGNRYQAIKLDVLDQLPPEIVLITMIGDTDTVARDTDARKIIRQSGAVPAARKMLIRLPTDSHGSPSLFATHLSPLAQNESYEMDKIPVVDADAPPPVQLDAKGRPRRAAPAKTTVVPSPQPDQFAGAQVDALDWYGLWKTLDIAMPIAFAGEDATPIKRHPGFTSMGLWSDGWPVKRLSYESAREPHSQPQADSQQPATTSTATRPKR
ncbi:MAG: alpha/beta hydrolase [Rhizobiales bacterium]|nr:alpha/beta hydrolase [Hyphomicrobiales bacterium]